MHSYKQKVPTFFSVIKNKTMLMEKKCVFFCPLYNVVPIEPSECFCLFSVSDFDAMTTITHRNAKRNIMQA